LSLPEKLAHIFFSDIDSMYQKMDQSNVFDRTLEEILRAASLVGVNSFFIVVGDTSLENKVDQGFWHNTESGLDPTDGSLSVIKDKFSKGEVSHSRVFLIS
jgi:hypothetical protein